MESTLPTLVFRSPVVYYMVKIILFSQTRKFFLRKLLLFIFVNNIW